MIDLFEFLIVTGIFTAIIFYTIMTVVSTLQPAPAAPVSSTPASTVKVTEPTEIRIIIQTVPADAGTQKE